ncbi:hypothetical protein ACH52_2668 [Eubacterium limosum]|nr:hypothetical protein ACH52_2668 [Eubacterium limosum]
MDVALAVMGQDIQPCGLGRGGHLSHAHAGAVEVGGGAALVEGPGHAAHFLVAGFAPHAGGDDDRAAQPGSQGLDLFKQLGLQAVGIAVAVTRAVAGILPQGEMRAGHGLGGGRRFGGRAVRRGFGRRVCGCRGIGGLCRGFGAFWPG